MHFSTTAVVEDITAIDNTKLMEDHKCWKPQFYVTVRLLF